MQNRDLFNLLQLFNKREISNLRRFLESPYFNRKPLCLQLFDYLIANRDDEGTALEEEFVQNNAFDQSVSTAYFRKLKSELKKLVEEFLSLERIRKNSFYMKYQLMEELLERNALDALKSARKELEQQQGKMVKDSEHLYEIYLKELFDYKLSHSLGISTNAEGPKKILEGLDQYYFLVQSNYLCEAFTRREIFATSVDVEKRFEIMSQLASFEHVGADHLATAFFDVSRLYNSQDEDLFQALKTKVIEGKFPKKGWLDLSTLLENYCVERMNMGNTKYINELYELYKGREENGLLMKKGIIQDMLYKNLITIGLLAKKRDWVEGFKEAYRNNLPAATREETYKLCSCIVFFRDGKFKEIIEWTSDKQTFKKNILFELHRRYIRMKACYELDEDLQAFMPDKKWETVDFFTKECKNFIAFLQRREVAANIRLSYAATAQVLIRLAEIRTSINARINLPEAEKSLNRFLQRIDRQYEYLAEKGYVLEKIGELLPS